MTVMCRAIVPYMSPKSRHLQNMRELRRMVDASIEDVFQLDISYIDDHHHPPFPPSVLDTAIERMRLCVEHAIQNAVVYDTTGRYIYEVKRLRHFDAFDQGAAVTKTVQRYRSFIVIASFADDTFRLRRNPFGPTHYCLQHWTSFYMDAYCRPFDLILMVMRPLHVLEYSQAYGWCAPRSIVVLVDRRLYHKSAMYRRDDKFIELIRNDRIDRHVRLDGEILYADRWGCLTMREFTDYHSHHHYNIERMITLDLVASRIQRAWRHWRSKKKAALTIWEHWQFVASNPYRRLGRDRLVRDLRRTWSDITSLPASKRRRQGSTTTPK
jgi:hypothetical protein